MANGIVIIDAESCKSCGLCIKTCPKKLLAFGEMHNSKGYHPPVQNNPEECIACGLCGLMCPDSAIQVYKEEM